MKKVLIFLSLFFLYAPIGTADFLKGGYPLCVTLEFYEQIQGAIVDNNESEIQYLLKSGCFMLTSAAKITVLDSSVWSGVAKVRVFAGPDEAFVMWTSVKNIKKE